MLYIVVGILAAINVLAFVLWGIDKAKAKAGAWRISESALLCVALFGGSLGALLGMLVFRHKTKKWQFKIGVPVCLMYHAGLILLFWMLQELWGFTIIP